MNIFNDHKFFVNDTQPNINLYLDLKKTYWSFKLHQAILLDGVRYIHASIECEKISATFSFELLVSNDFKRFNYIQIAKNNFFHAFVNEDDKDYVEIVTLIEQLVKKNRILIVAGGK